MIIQLKHGYRLHTIVLFYIIVFRLAICNISPVNAQQIDIQNDDIVETALNHAISLYDKKMLRNTSVYAGRSYYDPHAGVKGHQFFREDYWEQGRVNYNNNFYDSIFIKYDVYKDLLIIENFNSDGFLSPIVLYSPNVSSFDLMEYHFVRLEKDTISNLRKGFYNQMYRSKELQVLIKRKKEIVQTGAVHSIHGMFTNKDKYYIKKGEIYFQVRRKKSIIKVLTDHKKEVKNFIKNNNYYFKTAPDGQLVEVVKYYDSLQ